MTEETRPGASRPHSALDGAVLASARLAGSSLAAEIRAMNRAMNAGQGGFLDLGALLQPVVHATAGFRLSAPPEDAAPAMTVAEIARRTDQRGAPPTAPSITLATLTFTRDPSNDPHDGALVYVLQWDNVRWRPSGPPPARGQSPRDRDAIGTQLTIVDADTGDVIRTSLSGTTQPEN